MFAAFAWPRLAVGVMHVRMIGWAAEINNSNLLVFFRYQDPVRLSSAQLVRCDLRSWAEDQS
jgi:hypothetical protein